MFNRAYAAQWGGDATNPSLELHYDAPDVYPAGASIDKTVQIEGPATVRVDYRVKLAAEKGENAGLETGEHTQAFVAVNSFPASNAPGHLTQFCWAVETRGDGKSATAANYSGGRSASQCTDFSPHGKTIEVPEGVKQVEVRSPGLPTMVFEWECGQECARLSIEPKNYSGLFRLEFPPLKPGGEAGVYTVRIRPFLQP